MKLIELVGGPRDGERALVPDDLAVLSHQITFEDGSPVDQWGRLIFDRALTVYYLPTGRLTPCGDEIWEFTRGTP